MTAHIPENEVGRAADAEAALSPSATAPVVAALPGNDQPRWTPGPWHWAGPLVPLLQGANGAGILAVEGGCEPTLANARLIAAAPDMHYALSEMIERFGHIKCLPVDAARAALAKARGQ